MSGLHPTKIGDCCYSCCWKAVTFFVYRWWVLLRICRCLLLLGHVFNWRSVSAHIPALLNIHWKITTIKPTLRYCRLACSEQNNRGISSENTVAWIERQCRAVRDFYTRSAVRDTKGRRRKRKGVQRHYIHTSTHLYNAASGFTVINRYQCPLIIIWCTGSDDHVFMRWNLVGSVFLLAYSHLCVHCKTCRCGVRLDQCSRATEDSLFHGLVYHFM